MVTLHISGRTHRLIEQLATFGDRNEDDVLLRELSKLVEERYGPQSNGASRAPDANKAIVARSRRPSSADVIRREYVRKLQEKGIDLKLDRGIWGLLGNQWVALPFSSELGTGKWWLGVLEKEVVKRRPVIALLCQSDSGDLFDIIIHPEQFAGMSGGLTVAKNGQYMIDVDSSGGRFLLKIPGGRSVDVSDRLGNWT
jgi:hypothetical protein